MLEVIQTYLSLLVLMRRNDTLDYLITSPLLKRTETSENPLT